MDDFKYYNETKNTQLTQAHPSDAGYDLYYYGEKTNIPAYDRKLFGTGLYLSIPEGFVGIVKSRSGRAVKDGIEVGAGVIDSHYRGEIKVLLHNLTPNNIIIDKGDKIAQLCIIPIAKCQLVEVINKEDLGLSDRGSNGFGSSGR